MHELQLDPFAKVIARVCVQFTQLHDGAGQEAAQPQRLFAKASQIHRGQAESLDGQLEQSPRRRLR
jgi:hypothetical protein